MTIKEQEDERQLPTELTVRAQKHINETVNHVQKWAIQRREIKKGKNYSELEYPYNKNQEI